MRLVPLPLDRIIRVVADEFNVSVDQLSKGRGQLATKARRFYMCVALEFTEAPPIVISARIKTKRDATYSFIRNHRANYLRLPTMEILREKMRAEIQRNGPLLPSYRPRNVWEASKHIEAEAGRVCIDHGVTVEAMRGRSRDPRLTAARMDFCKRARAIGESTPAIGRYLGRDHATVVYYLKGGRNAASRLEHTQAEMLPPLPQAHNSEAVAA